MMDHVENIIAMLLLTIVLLAVLLAPVFGAGYTLSATQAGLMGTGIGIFGTFVTKSVAGTVKQFLDKDKPEEMQAPKNKL